ncbi:holin [Bacillaceae bacterium Marseille-Q3522]|nr:holin [Bacillaceae bacterium Marseille-Q3522]
MKNVKWKNYGLWVALGSLVVMFLNDALHVTPETTQPYVDVILSVLVAGGVISNPSNGNGFRDK